MTLNESMVEEAALGWFKKLGYAVRHGTPHLHPGIPPLNVRRWARRAGGVMVRGILQLNAAPLRTLSAQTPVAPD
jgi:hypothetical protein